MKISSKQIKHLNVRPKTIKVLEENKRVKMSQHWIWSSFWDRTTMTKTQATREKIDKLDFLKIFNRRLVEWLKW
jgi:hypothetical protein